LREYGKKIDISHKETKGGTKFACYKSVLHEQNKSVSTQKSKKRKRQGQKMELFIRRSRRLLRTALAVAVALLLTAAVTVTAGAKEVGEEGKMLIPGDIPSVCAL
jgi:hypothetical protein